MANTVLGKVSCVPRGDYSASATYTVLDIAGYQGGSYMALKTVTGVTPSNDGVNWMQLSGPGLPGEQGEQGEPGAAAGFGQATATVDESTGTPSVDVTTSGPDTAKVFNFAFSGLKGETGAKGDTGDKGDTGATGPQGVSVTDAEIDESGHLIITLSAGEPIDAGNAVGPTGAKGDTGATGPEGASVSRIERTSGTGAPGTTDTYTVYLTDGSTGGTFQVYNGANGTGSGDFMADGTVPMSGALQMGGNRITNVGAPTADTDAVRQSDLKAVSDEVDKILDGTTPVAIPAATTAKIGGVIVGDGLSVETNGTISADSQLPEGGTAGQILTKTANGETWADPPDTGVTTFNNRSGAVVPQTGDYTAEMVGARPDTWVPTADDVGAIANPSGGSDGQMLYKTASGAEWGIPPYLGSMPQLDSAQMKSLHALGITDLNNVTESGTYVGMGGEFTGYPTVSNIPSEVANSPFILNVYTLTAPVDSGYAGNIVVIQECRGIVSMLGGEPKVFYRPATASIHTETVWSWGEWTRPVSVASSTEFTPTSTLTSDNVQDAIEEVQSNIPTDYIPTSEKGANSGVASLDSTGKVPASQLPDMDYVPTSRTVNNKELSANITLNASDVGAATAADVEGAKPMLRTATLTTSGWSSNSQTVTVSGVVADTSAQLIYVSPADKASATAWGEAGVFCSAQGANSLTFVCDSTPSANITVNISIQEAQT